jgi:hypothetical protein
MVSEIKKRRTEYNGGKNMARRKARSDPAGRKCKKKKAKSKLAFSRKKALVKRICYLALLGWRKRTRRRRQTIAIQYEKNSGKNANAEELLMKATAVGLPFFDWTAEREEIPRGTMAHFRKDVRSDDPGGVDECGKEIDNKSGGVFKWKTFFVNVQIPRNSMKIQWKWWKAFLDY